MKNNIITIKGGNIYTNIYALEKWSVNHNFLHCHQKGGVSFMLPFDRIESIKEG